MLILSYDVILIKQEENINTGIETTSMLNLKKQIEALEWFYNIKY